MLHVACLTLAILVKKIDVIFDLAGAICCAFSIFLFPGVGYLIALKKYSDAKSSWLYLISSWVFLALGLSLIVAAIYINVMRATGKLPAEVDA